VLTKVRQEVSHAKPSRHEFVSGILGEVVASIGKDPEVWADSKLDSAAYISD
jgi:hypothetical protein